jgi:hypothetical protein
MEIREFLVAIPALCGAEDAERAGWINGQAFDYERDHAASAFKRNTNDQVNPENRMNVLFNFTGGDPVKTAYCKKLVRIAELAHYKKSRVISVPENEELNTLVSEAMVEESDASVSAIASVMSVESVATNSGWNG